MEIHLNKLNLKVFIRSPMHSWSFESEASKSFFTFLRSSALDNNAYRNVAHREDAARGWRGLRRAGSERRDRMAAASRGPRVRGGRHFVWHNCALDARLAVQSNAPERHAHTRHSQRHRVRVPVLGRYADANSLAIQSLAESARANLCAWGFSLNGGCERCDCNFVIYIKLIFCSLELSYMLNG